MRGNWSFIHEWIIYDYMHERFKNSAIRLKRVVYNGTLERRERWEKIISLETITNTAFPDIEGIKIGGSEVRPAEVKFTTSTFKYHKTEDYKEKFREFVKHNGCIIVLSHDYLPIGLNDKIDVYEIDRLDFVAFCKENFERLLNRQINLHTETKVWLMYQGPNFYLGSDSSFPAKKSKIWCPTENLTGFDLAPGDRVLFVKTKGASTQLVQRLFLENKNIEENWILQEVVIAEVKSKIRSRREYCSIKKIDYEDTQLWKNDPHKDEMEWRWSRVFEFDIIKTIAINTLIIDLYKVETAKGFVEALVQVFCFGRSRELGLREYRDLLEVLV